MDNADKSDEWQDPTSSDANGNSRYIKTTWAERGMQSHSMH